MQMDKDLKFISSKIEELQVALFHCPSNSLLKIPSTVVHTFKVDNDGHILFFLPRPTQLISQFDKDFPVDLNYFKKGAAAYLNIYGKARIINDPEELFEYDLTAEEVNKALNKEILLVVKILKADYHVGADPTSNQLLQKIKSTIYGLLAWVEPRTKRFDFSKQQLPNYGF